MMSNEPTSLPDSGSTPTSKLKQIRQWFLTGLVFLGPLVLTIWIVIKLFLLTDSILGKPIRLFLAEVLDLQYFKEGTIYGIGFFVLMGIILLAGWFARQYLGVRVAGVIKSTVQRIPLVNKVYLAIFQISEALLGGQKEVFKQAVLIEYPRKGTYCIGFMTQDTRGPIQDAIKEDVISIFLPTTPNPTSGFLLFYPKTDVVLLHVSVAEALKLIISAGAVVPESQRGRPVTASQAGIIFDPPGSPPNDKEGKA
ncbi:DUF502 domain-containing protein [bacterium]|nr:DUF502 domain-containing protein [bacterium]